MNIETTKCESSINNIAYEYTYRGADYTIILSEDDAKDKNYCVNVWRKKGRHVSLSVYFWRNGAWKTNEGRSMGKYMKDIIAFIEADIDAAVA